MALLVLLVIAVAGITAWKVLQIDHTSSTTTSTSKAGEAGGCATSTAQPSVDQAIRAESRAAFVARGFSAQWFDKHFQLTSAQTTPNTTQTTLTWRVCVGDYTTSLQYFHHLNGNSNTTTLATPAHDIVHVLSKADADAALTKCGGLTASTTVAFDTIAQSGAPFPSQTRLYFSGSTSTAPKNSAQNITSRSTDYVNIDLETGKCFVTTTYLN